MHNDLMIHSNRHVIQTYLVETSSKAILAPGATPLWFVAYACSFIIGVGEKERRERQRRERERDQRSRALCPQRPQTLGHIGVCGQVVPLWFAAYACALIIIIDFLFITLTCNAET